MSSPPKSQYVSEVRVSDSDEVSDSDNSDSEDQPLISVISSAHQRQSWPITHKDLQESDLRSESPPPPEISNDDFEDVEADLSIRREMVRKAMSTLEKTNDVSCLFFEALTRS